MLSLVLFPCTVSGPLGRTRSFNCMELPTFCFFLGLSCSYFQKHLASFALEQLPWIPIACLRLRFADYADYAVYAVAISPMLKTSKGLIGWEDDVQADDAGGAKGTRRTDKERISDRRSNDPPKPGLGSCLCWMPIRHIELMS